MMGFSQKITADYPIQPVDFTKVKITGIFGKADYRSLHLTLCCLGASRCQPDGSLDEEEMTKIPK